MEIFPYIGIDNMAFGQPADCAISLFGAPMGNSVGKNGKLKLFFDGFILAFDAEGLSDIVVSPDIDVEIFGIKIFKEKNAFKTLVKMDATPLLGVGVVVLRDIGIALTGFHDCRIEQLSVGAFRRGGWDSLLHRLHPFTL